MKKYFVVSYINETIKEHWEPYESKENALKCMRNEDILFEVTLKRLGKQVLTYVEETDESV